jgi:WD40 repeat protein
MNRVALLARGINRLGARRSRLRLGAAAVLVLIGAGLGYRWWTDWPVQVALDLPGQYWPLAFSPDGATLLTTGSDEDITVWDMASGRKQATWARPPGSGFVDGAFAPDGRTFAALWFDGSSPPGGTFGMDLIDTATGRVRARVPTTDGFSSTLAFVESTVVCYMGTHAGAMGAHAGVPAVIDHDAASGRERRRRSLSCPDSGWWVVSRDGRVLVQRRVPANATTGAAQPADVVVWDAERDCEIARLPGRIGDPQVIMFDVSSDGKTVAVGREDGSILLWDYRTARVRATYNGHKTGFGVMDLAFSPDGSTLVSVGRFTDTAVTVGNLSTQVGILARNRRGIPVMDLIVLDVASGRRLQRAAWEGCPVFSPDGRWLATTDGTSINIRRPPRASGNH